MSDGDDRDIEVERGVRDGDDRDTEVERGVSDGDDRDCMHALNEEVTDQNFP